jgi:hypothetical protein
MAVLGHVRIEPHPLGRRASGENDHKMLADRDALGLSAESGRDALALDPLSRLQLARERRKAAQQGGYCARY